MTYQVIRGFKVGDVVTFNYRASGSSPPARVEVGIINELFYAAGDRGPQDRLGIDFVNPPYERWPSWIYSTSVKSIELRVEDQQ